MKIYFRDELPENAPLVKALGRRSLRELVMAKNPLLEMKTNRHLRSYEFVCHNAGMPDPGPSSFVWIDLTRFQDIEEAVKWIDHGVLNRTGMKMEISGHALFYFHNALSDSVKAVSTVKAIDLNGANLVECIKLFHSECRSFNKISFSDNSILKKIYWQEKASSELFFYENLPVSMKRFFPKFIRSKKTSELSEYEIELIPDFDLALYYINNALNTKKFGLVLEAIEGYSLASPKIFKQKSEVIKRCEELFLQKCRSRLNQFYQLRPEYRKKIFKFSENDSSIDGVFQAMEKRFKTELAGYRHEEFIFSHGDMVFSNIIFLDNKELKLIDPRGAVSLEEIYLPPLYDLAKLSQCVLGDYDHQFFGLSDTSTELKNYFVDWIGRQGVSVSLVSAAECSLFLSLLALHTENAETLDRFVKCAWQALNREFYAN